MIFITSVIILITMLFNPIIATNIKSRISCSNSVANLALKNSAICLINRVRPFFILWNTHVRVVKNEKVTPATHEHPFAIKTSTPAT